MKVGYFTSNIIVSGFPRFCFLLFFLLEVSRRKYHTFHTNALGRNVDVQSQSEKRKIANNGIKKK